MGKKVCKNCKHPFQEQQRRHKCSTLFPDKKGFYCSNCFRQLRKKDRMSPSKQATSTEGGKKSDKKSKGQHDQKLKCAFCGHGEKANRICGRMYDAKVDGSPLAAHRKCMQYTGNLIQYEFDNFGGFYIKDVLKAIKGAMRRKCSICGRTKATSGCEWGNCMKKFHFYCAALDKTVVTSKTRSLDKKEGISVDSYRSFCCADHMRRYKKDLVDSEHSASDTEEEVLDSQGHSQSGTRKSAASAKARKDAVESSTEDDDDSSALEGEGVEMMEQGSSSNQEMNDEEEADEENGAGDSGDEVVIEIDRAEEGDETDLGQNEEDSRMERSRSSYDPYGPIHTSSDSSDSEHQPHTKTSTPKPTTSNSRQSQGKKKTGEGQALPEMEQQKTASVASSKKNTPEKRKQSPQSEEEESEPEKKSSGSTKKSLKARLRQQQSGICGETSDEIMEIADRVKKRTAKRKLVLSDETESEDEERPSSIKKEKATISRNGSTKSLPSTPKIKAARVNAGMAQHTQESKLVLSNESESGDDESSSSPVGAQRKVSTSTESATKTSDSQMSENYFVKVGLDRTSGGHEQPHSSEKSMKKKPDDVSDSKKDSVRQKTMTPAGKTKDADGSAARDGTAQNLPSTSASVSAMTSQVTKQTGKAKTGKPAAAQEQNDPVSSSQSAEQGTPALGPKTKPVRITVTADVYNSSTQAEEQEKCVLVIPVDVKRFQTVSAAVCSQLAEKYQVDTEHVHDWTSIAPLPLPEGCMFFYFYEISLCLKKQDWSTLELLLSSGEIIQKKFQDEYLQKRDMNKQDEELNLQEEFENTTQKVLAVTLRGAEQRTGCPAGNIMDEADAIYLALVINDTIDPEYCVRNKLHAPSTLFGWMQDGRFDPTFSRVQELLSSCIEPQLCAERMQNLPRELAVLQAWLSKTVSHVFQCVCCPDNVDMQLDFEPEELDAFSQLRMKIDSLPVARGCPDPQSAPEPSAVVLLFHKVDKAVLTFEMYLTKILNRYVDEGKAHHVICLTPACNFKDLKSALRSYSGSKQLKISSALNPTEQSVTFLVLELTVKEKPAEPAKSASSGSSSD